MVFANNEPLSGHLWYLMAYAYALIIIAILAQKDKIQWLKYMTIIGLALYFLFDIWHIYYNVPKYLTLVYCFRNFFFTAIPMMFIGAITSNKYLLNLEHTVLHVLSKTKYKRPAKPNKISSLFLWHS